jgi:hypothetical protein
MKLTHNAGHEQTFFWDEDSGEERESLEGYGAPEQISLMGCIWRNLTNIGEINDREPENVVFSPSALTDLYTEIEWREKNPAHVQWGGFGTERDFSPVHAICLRSRNETKDEFRTFTYRVRMKSILSFN